KEALAAAAAFIAVAPVIVRVLAPMLRVLAVAELLPMVSAPKVALAPRVRLFPPEASLPKNRMLVLFPAMPTLMVSLAPLALSIKLPVRAKPFCPMVYAAAPLAKVSPPSDRDERSL